MKAGMALGSDTWLVIEVGVTAIVVAATLAAILRGAGRNRHLAWGTVVAVVTLLAASARIMATARHLSSTEVLTDNVPRLGRPDAGFVSSDTCRSCHPHQYHSWHRSYHRTMTQLAVGENVIGDFENVTLGQGVRSIHLTRDGDSYLADMVDPDWELKQLWKTKLDPVETPLRAHKRVVMTTGLHHYQAYWVPSEYGRMLINFPYVFLDGRWVRREAVFLRPPDAARHYQQWNTSCIKCHSVAGEPGLDPESNRLDTSVAELGISCEACHGPAADHVRVNRDPVRRYGMYRADDADPTIVQPERLSAARSSEVCGQCHGISIPRPDPFGRGERYHAGDELADTTVVIRGRDTNLDTEDREEHSQLMARLAEVQPSFLRDRYWPDGMVRISGREYNGLVESPCYQGGDFSCLTCHSMHDSDPDDQLKPDMDGDAACIGCHDTERYAAESHTHHGPSSAGSGCLNCHMPYTTYGLLKAIRSHQVDSPDAQVTVDTGRPNACNLCHLDRTLAWTAEHLDSWYGRAVPDLDDDQRTIAASVLGALRGDAGERALTAGSRGWAPAHEASGDNWLAPYLANLLDDPYAAVRYIAHRSLRAVPGYEGFAYDFVAPAALRSEAMARARAAWRGAAEASARRSAVLLDESGAIDVDCFQRLRRERDDSLVELQE